MISIYHSSSNRPNSFQLTKGPFLLCLSTVPFISFIFLSAANLFLKYFGASLPSLHLHHRVACVYKCVCARVCVAETICSTNELQKTAEGWKPSSVHTGFVEVKRVSSFMFHCVHIVGTPTPHSRHHREWVCFSRRLRKWGIFAQLHHR